MNGATQGASINWRGMANPDTWTAQRSPDSPYIPCIFPCSQEFPAEKGWLRTGSTATESGGVFAVLRVTENRRNSRDIAGVDSTKLLSQRGKWAGARVQEEWDVVSFPAIAEREESFVIQSPWGTRRQTRQIGDLLHPERESHATLAQIRRTMGEWNFAGQYQQAPAPHGGGMVKAEWFLSYGPEEQPDLCEQIVQSWDTASKETELSDYSVCTTWGIKGKKILLLHVLRKRLNFPDLKRAVREQAVLHRATVVLIEDKASGTQLIQELVHEGLSIVQGVEPEGNKVMRLHAQTAIIENGFVSLPKEASWLAEYLHELTTFPKSKHDDQADSTAQALAWIKARQTTTIFSHDMGWESSATLTFPHETLLARLMGLS